MHFSIIVFPGSNCDRDCYHVVKNVLHQEADFIWHKDFVLPKTDCVILPGGFSYGDYLRCGAIANFSPIMKEVVAFANKGGKVLGICNGFQILTESRLLPGVLLRNKNLHFICKTVNLKVVNAQTSFTDNYKLATVVQMPIAHAEGNYFADPDTLKSLQDNQQIAFQYCDESGEVNEAANPNGALRNIAGIFNKEKNVLGLMPHPERLSESILGGEDGRKIFEGLL
ncbi:MAG: phosphoribosylformylglycinamidine synthase subunit PurQ [Deltaproteobacteria bacterium]|nr:phosphoribosylformylglycinamidine synthase subunit PurQ [Deltaproteobacteria bacterium]